MSTEARTVAVHSPLGWFTAGVVATLVASALVASVVLTTGLPAAGPGTPAQVGASATILDPGYLAQRAAEINGGRSMSLPGLGEQRRGEIGAGALKASEPGLPALTDHRRGEIRAGGSDHSITPIQTLTDHRRGEVGGGK